MRTCVYILFKYLTWWQEHYFAHMAVRSQDNSNLCLLVSMNLLLPIATKVLEGHFAKQTKVGEKSNIL